PPCRVAAPPGRVAPRRRCPAARQSGRPSLRAALEDVGIGDLHRSAALRSGEQPAAFVIDHAAFHGLASHRRLLDESLSDAAAALDHEQHRHLPVQLGLLRELLLVAVLDLVVVLLDHAVDHIARQAADDDRAAGHEHRLVLPAPAEIDVAVPASTMSGALGAEASDAQRLAAATCSGAAGAQTADAICIADARPGARAAERRIDAGAEPSRPGQARAATTHGSHLRESGDEAELLDLRQILPLLVRIATGLRRRRFLLLRFPLAELSFGAGALVALLGSGPLLRLGRFGRLLRG